MLAPRLSQFGKFVPLFFIAFLSMFIFQLVTRLTEYSFMFHQGVLLLSSALIGASLALIGMMLIPKLYRAYCVRVLPYFLLVSWLCYLVLFLNTQSLVVHFVALSLVFGTLFLLITENIHLTPNNFTAVELIGSFIGAGTLVILSAFVLEEWLIISAVLGIFLYIFYSGAWRHVWPMVNGGFLMVVIVAVYIFSTNSLPELIVCPDRTETYKIACIESSDTFTLTSSIANINGRSDVFINTSRESPRLSVYKSGLHSGTSLLRPEYKNLINQYHDVEIPPLDYPAGGKVAAAGASTGSNILTLQNYVPQADVTLVETDTIINDLYQTQAYVDFLPEPDSFKLVYQDVRTFFETSDTKFDVISMMVEAVNSTLEPYTDESTSLVYTTEALRTYREALTPGGYLLLQQFHTNGEQGDAMIHKVLASLEAALEPAEAATLKENILLYSYTFTSLPNAKRYLAVVYKPAGFSTADSQIFNEWLKENNEKTVSWNNTGPIITVLHTPDGKLTYDVYFDDEKRAALASVQNTSVITDDKPFRHLVTTLPFPSQYYVLILICVAVMVLLLSLLSLKKRMRSSLLPLSFAIGLVTFGLQYVLYYKTAAFIGTSLIYFSVFLLIPLLFGAIGGYLSYKLRLGHAIGLFGCGVGAAVLLLLSATFSLVPAVVVGLLLILFVFSGTLFPLLLAQADEANERLLLYAVNMGGGGAATIMVISLHAVVGWTYLFVALFTALCLFFGYLFYLFSQT